MLETLVQNRPRLHEGKGIITSRHNIPNYRMTKTDTIYSLCQCLPLCRRHASGKQSHPRHAGGKQVLFPTVLGLWEETSVSVRTSCLLRLSNFA